MGFLWHSPSEGPLSHPFTNYTHNTSYRPNARGGPSSNFRQSPELCVWRQANIYQPQKLTTGDRGICHFLGLRCVFTRVPSYPTTHVVTVAYLVCVYLLYGGPTIRTHRIVKFLGLRYLTTWVPGRRDLDTQILGRTQSSWSALIYYVNARPHGRTRNDRLLVGPVAPNYVCYR